jgi:hypothetical protein
MKVKTWIITTLKPVTTEDTASALSFEALIGALENGEDEVKSKYIQARDVTEEYIDVESRLNNERAYWNVTRHPGQGVHGEGHLAIEESIAPFRRR